jgi:hypothetical protein
MNVEVLESNHCEVYALFFLTKRERPGSKSALSWSALKKKAP